VDTARLLHSLGGMLRRTLDERVRLDVQVQARAGEAGPFCRADPAQLEGALLNMAINARDAMPDGGTLAFSARALEGLPAAVAQAWPQLADGRYVELGVRDDGQGMSDAVRARAFEPFFTTKEAGRGTGLGLATVYGFVQQSLGAITLDSAPGRGTTIHLYLPAWPEQAVPPPQAARRAAVRRDLRVLLVEDDADVRAVVRGYFDGHAAQVRACADADEALALLHAGVPFDLLLSDIALGPGPRGTELAERAAALRPGLAVLLMTGYDSAPAVPAPRWTILAKPFDRDTLLAALATLLPAR
jgi:CheY-like chemotaxis protein